MTNKKGADKPEPQKEAVAPVEKSGSVSPHVPESTFPVVGIGASAGGLAAFEAFFSGMPTGVGPGMAFVLVQHLAPDHKSILSELVKRFTTMQVFEVEDGTQVKPNCCYVIPSNHDMAFLGGRLQLMEPASPHGQRLPIDFFFRSLAQGLRERAICIVLSGTGSDGALGVRAVKGEGGMVMAQNPESTQYDGMPRSAIDTGVVDYVLEPAAMPARLIAYAAQAFGKLPRTVSAQASKADNSLSKIFVLLRAQTGHDFSQYKPSSVQRRIKHRMSVHRIEKLSEYVLYLQQTMPEVEALFRDLLIGVTQFFRDPAAFKALENQVIPKLFAGKPDGAMVRVWSPGCSTGEEAYSVAILLKEGFEAQQQGFKVQVFATDIDSRAIATARSGTYPANIASDIATARLERFFTAEPGAGSYRVNKSIRDMLVFSEQNVIKDPPFSKLDLIVCRNLLIYMNKDLHKKLISLFHYALNPGGFLLLGTSETIGGFEDLFAALDGKLKLYQRKDNVYGAKRLALSRFLSPMAGVDAVYPPAAEKTTDPEKLPLRVLTELALLRQITPAGALVDGQGVILYLHGRTGRYLEPAPGEAGASNILKMAREGLRRELTTALHKADTSKKIVRRPGLQVKTNGDFTTVNLAIHPVEQGPATTLQPPLFLVILEDAPPAGQRQAKTACPRSTSLDDGPAADAARHIEALDHELRAKEELLLTTTAELETTVEELKLSNEKMQVVSEEMQSIKEEFETSKEELQSLNEELATVNAELQTKVEDLSRANNDMNNLLAGTGIATVFVDQELRILRFTPTATLIINLISADVGRPVRHIVSNLVNYDRLVEDAQVVLDTLASKEIEVQTTEGKWYTMSIQPYRTLENVVEGAVITFVDITEIKKSQELLKQANDQLHLAVVVRDSHDAIVMTDLDGRIMAWNPSAQRIFGWSETEALAMNIRDLIPEKLRGKALDIIRQIIKGDFQMPYITQRIAKDGKIVEVWLTATALVNETGQVYAIATTERVTQVRNDS
ncbi:MAG: PAS domain-containing protein [Desulfovibrionaceae bacterium]|nr:PAS domain-containing protein [Desulfovibrionaceae bacterium]MBF0514429.1 PAS domain-containing protein [Desulfovibrionaceae bacterium]